MAKRAALFLFILFQTCLAAAQSTGDSVRPADTQAIQQVLPDSPRIKMVRRKPVKALPDSAVVFYTDSLRFSATKPGDFSNLPLSLNALLAGQPAFNFTGTAVRVRSEQFERESYEGIFYLLVLMLFYFAIVKLFFPKYLANLLTIFFRASMRQQQLREQVLQSPFPSLLLNSLFIFSGGLYGAFLLRYYHFGRAGSLWFYFLSSAALLAVLYLGKFLILKLAGWIFNINYTADTYLFVVFMTNKIIGMFLLPFLVIMSFSGPLVTEIAITVSLIMIGIFFIYRFVAAYTTLRKEIKISGLHFILYLCALEIAPLLLIYKVLLTYLEKAY